MAFTYLNFTVKRGGISRPSFSAGLLTAIFLCLLWACSPAQEAEIFVPVIAAGMPQNLCLARPLPEGLKVRINGPQSAVRTLSEHKLKYTIDLSSLKSGIQTMSVDTEAIRLPKGVRFIQSVPDSFTLAVEKKIQKQVPVTLTLSGKPASGFIVSRTTAIPHSVILTGPETVLIPLNEIRTKPVDLTGQSDTFKKEVALAIAGNIRIAPPADRIVGEVVIEEIAITREFHNIRVKGTEADGSYSITPPVLSIVVKGPENILKQLTPAKDISVSVGLEGLTPGVYVRRAVIALPVKTTLIDVNPDLFTVKIDGK